MRLKRQVTKLAKLGIPGAIKILFHMLFFGKVFAFFEKIGLHVFPVHYSSPVPDTRELRRNIHQWNKHWDFTGIDFRDEQQLQFLKHLSKFENEYNALPLYDTIAAIGYGDGYGVVESHILYAYIRYLKPKQIIEIGSGISTYFSITALRKNKEAENINSKMICIEPFPKKALFTLSESEHSTVELIPKLLQDIDIKLFKTLKENDILFIDSSHVAKLNSDVYHIYLEILPNLNKGVIIHIHDIYFPHLTPDDVESWIFKRHLFWNECAILKAFLTFNNAFEILLCPSYLHYNQPDRLNSAFKVYDEKKHFPSSLWLRKIQ